MKLEFIGLVIEHFGSFTNKQNIKLRDLEVGVHFIRGVNKVEKLGPNGSGKSTMVNAISWCLYGKTTNNLKATDIKPWESKGKPRVIVSVRIDDELYTITRTAPNFLELNGKEVGQDEVDRLLRMNYAVFKQTVIFGQREPLFFDLPNKDKLSLLSEVLELDKWEVRSQKAGERTRELELREQVLAKELNILESAQLRNEKFIEEATDAEDMWEENEARKEKRSLEERKKLVKELAELNELRDAVQPVIQQEESWIAKNKADLKLAKDELTALEQDLAVRAERVKQIILQLEQLDKELVDLEKAKTCPTCGQEISRKNVVGHKKHLQDRLAVLELKLDKEKAVKNDKLLAKLESEYETIQGKAMVLESKVKARRIELGNYNHYIIQAETKIKTIDDTKAERDKEINPHTAQLKRLKLEAKELKAEAVRAKEDFDKAQRLAVRSRYWVKGFKDVRLFVIEDVLQELELATNGMLEDMGLLGWSVKYAVERETKSGTIQSGMTISILSPRNKSAVKWEVWSGGEGQRLRLAGALALSEVLLSYAGIEIDMEILDEPTQHLSDEGVMDLCDMLVERSEQLGRKILYIDHMVVEGSQFASTITVTKTKEGSAISSTTIAYTQLCEAI